MSLPATARSAKLLVIEDEDIVRDFIVRVLQDQHEVTPENDAEEALARFESGRYDAAFIDLGMPGVSGDVIARSLRSRDSALPTILTTGWDLDESDPRLSHFDFYLKKPFKTAALLATATEAVRLGDQRKSRLNG